MLSSQKDDDNSHHKTDDGKRKHSIDKKMVHELAASTSIEKSGKEKGWHDTENADQSPQKTDDMKPGEFFLNGHLFPPYLRTSAQRLTGLALGWRSRPARKMIKRRKLFEICAVPSVRRIIILVPALGAFVKAI